MSTTGEPGWQTTDVRGVTISVPADFAGGGQTQATVTALKEDFEPQKMHEVLGTVVITDKVDSD